ncbi:hypothetical protein WDZ92_38940, partial [Nostoc sp. NIES-2111]
MTVTLRPSDIATSALRRHPRLLFAMNHAGFFRNFERVVDRLCGEGVAVHVLLMRPHRSIVMEDYEIAADPSRRNGLFSWSDADALKPGRLTAAARFARDLLHYARPE